MQDLLVTLDDLELDQSLIQWAGLSPGFAGLYQINLQLPDMIGPDPQVRVWIDGVGSPMGVKVAAKP